MSKAIDCSICSNKCHIEPNELGICNARINDNGINKPFNYGTISSLALDPIEKKPLYNFYPGTNILSIGNFGCNLHCQFCQNHSISMTDGAQLQAYRNIKPEQIIQTALDLKDRNNIGIAFTYNEPLINFEYLLDVEKLAHENNLKTVVVTNGNINPSIFKKVAKETDAFNIDLKGINIYKKVGGDLDTVLENIKAANDLGSHVEVTTLVIPDENDSVNEIRKIAQYLSEINPEITLHLTRFFPQYKMLDKNPTPIETLLLLEKEAKKYLKNVYIGNV